VCVVLLLLSWQGGLRAQSTSAYAPLRKTTHVFSYQGSLANSQGRPVDSGMYLFRVSLYSDKNGTKQIWQGSYSTNVGHGVFNLSLGSGDYPLPSVRAMDAELYLGVGINGANELRPLTPLTASAFALNVADSSITSSKLATDYVSSVKINGEQISTRGGAVNFLPGQGIEMRYDSGAHGVTINSVAPIKSVATSGIGWDETGNTSTSPGTNYVGTADNTALEIHVNGAGAGGAGDGRVMRYEPQTTSANLIGGYNGNLVDNGEEGSTIAGGGQSGNINHATGDYATIGGGYGNTADNTAVVAGGRSNTASGQDATVSGGQSNSATDSYTTIGGGYNNHATGGAASDYAYAVTISGGEGNNASGRDATISGGTTNSIGDVNGTTTGGTIGGGGVNTIVRSSVVSPPTCEYSTISGGYLNTITGKYSAIPGGTNLTLNARSFGFNADNTAPTNLAAMDQIAYFGNVNLMIGNVDGTARELRFYQPNLSFNYTGPTYYTSFKANTQSANIDYTLPATQGAAATNTVLINPGTGILSWGNAGLAGAWSITGNLDIVDGTNYLGTNNNRPVDIRVNNLRAFRLEPNATSPAIIGGFNGNTVSGTTGSAILGGGQSGNLNVARGDFDVIGGGDMNVASLAGGTYKYSSVLGGHDNSALGSYDVVAGGYINYIFSVSGSSEPGYSFIGGGSHNAIHSDAGPTSNAVIAGGSHNHVLEDNGFIGAGDTNIVNEESGGIAAGFMNLADGVEDFIGAGAQNHVTGSQSMIGAGIQNYSSGQDNLIGAGSQNIIHSDQNVIGGGTYNSIYGTRGIVGGGIHNTIASLSSPQDGSAIVGGGYNQILSKYSFIGGGGDLATAANGNTIQVKSDYSLIGGGQSNQIGLATLEPTTQFNLIGGGSTNIIRSDHHSIIVGGEGNQIDALLAGGANPSRGGDHNVIVGGETNIIEAPTVANIAIDHNFIGGGMTNRIMYTTEDFPTVYSAIVGGMGNIVMETESFVGGGLNNSATEENTFVGGGEGNVANSPHSSVVGGKSNTITGLYSLASTIGGGRNNKIINNGVSSDIPGGVGLTAQCYVQTVIGSYNIPTGNFDGGVPFDTRYNNVITPLDPPDQPIFLIGNGTSDTSSNAFEVSYNGHSIVTHTNGVLQQRTIKGATYTDNIVRAWGEVTAAGAFVAGTGFGVSQVLPIALNQYQVWLDNMVDDNGNNVLLVNASVTATIEATNTNTDPGCATIVISPIGAALRLGVMTNFFMVWTHSLNLAATPPTCDQTRYPFAFKVCGR
jgi:hypothetical protein